MAVRMRDREWNTLLVWPCRFGPVRFAFRMTEAGFEWSESGQVRLMTSPVDGGEFDLQAGLGREPARASIN